MVKRLFSPALICALLSLLLAGPVFAQNAPTPQQRLDAVRAELDQIGSAMKREQLSDTELSARRAEVDPLAATINEVVEQLTPTYDSIKARLDQLGPGDKEKDKEKEKDATVDGERAEQQKAFSEVDGQLKRARAMALEVDQLKNTIVSRRRELFTSALFQRSSSILAPDLWGAVVGEIPRDVKAAGVVASDWFSAASSRLERWRALLFAAVLVGIAAGYLLASRLAKRVLRREPSVAEPTRLQQAVAALWVGFVTAVVPIVAVIAFAQALRSFDLVNARMEPLLQALVDSVRRIALAAGFVRGLLAPLRPTWRLFDFGDAVATRLAGLAMGVVSVVSLVKIIEAINEMIVVSLPVSVAVRGVGALAVALLMAFSLKGIVKPPEVDDECLGPRIEPQRDWYAPLRFLAWVVLSVIIGAVLIGYVAFGAFLAEQVVWIAFVGCLAFLLMALANEGFSAAVQPTAPLPRAISASLMLNLGVRQSSLDLLAVVLAGASSVVILIAAVLLALAPWGVESTDMLANFRSAFFGFKIGDVTISLSSIALALALFGIALFATRSVQQWLERKFLPHTQLDTGLRNSIRTSVGYLGAILAASLSLSYLGLSFERLAIVAGALSVGIGFGLQSIVNNFVSGLILLWERAIRVGDWVVLGDEQGYVRRINVRSTEIETFDRATMIVPNSNLVTGVVKNWVRGDKVGRIKIPVAVNLVADPEKVREILIELAKSHELVERIPAPNVMFIAMSETLLKFELICFVADVEKSARVKSDLHFAIHARFKAEDIGISPPAAPPPPPAIVQIGGLEKLESLLDSKK